MKPVPVNEVEQRRAASRSGFFARILRPLYVLLILCLAFGFSVVGKAAQKLKRTVKAKRTAWKVSHMNAVTARAWAHFRPAWNPTYDEKYPKPIARQKGIIEDPQGRVEREFRVPKDFRGRVAFWIDIYSRFTSHYRIVHDRDNPALVYGYIDFRSINRNFPPAVARWKRREIEKQVMAELKARISEATGLTRSKRSRLGDEEKESLRKLLAEHGHEKPDQIARRLRRIKSQTGQRDHYMTALVRARKVLPEIERVFKERGLPLALTRIPFVESSFNMYAVSKSGAIGMWQFLPEVAKRYDPRGTSKDWKDPIRQTYSAARMLTLLKDRLDDWSLAVTAYHSGVLRLERIKKQFGTDDIVEMAAIPPQRGTLGYAGKNYFAELLAANLVEAYREELFPSSFHRREAPAPVAKKAKRARKLDSLSQKPFAHREARPVKRFRRSPVSAASRGGTPYRARSRARRG